MGRPGDASAPVVAVLKTQEREGSGVTAYTDQKIDEAREKIVRKLDEATQKVVSKLDELLTELQELHITVSKLG